MGLGNFRQPRSPGRPTLRRRAAGALLALAAFVIPAAAQAQNTSDSQVVETQASIIGPGTMIKIADIDFGKIVRPLSAGTVVLAPTANPPCTLTGGVEVRSGPCTSAYFAIMGRNMGVVRISKLDAVSVVLNGSNGGTMTMTNLVMSYQNLVLCSGSGVGNCGSGGGGCGNGSCETACYWWNPLKGQWELGCGCGSMICDRPTPIGAGAPQRSST